MDLTLGVIALVVFVAVMLLRSRGKGRAANLRRDRNGSSALDTAAAKAALRTFNAHKAWLQARWKTADEQQQAGNASSYPAWYFDAATPRQMERIASEGLSLPGGKLSKGQASDIIGLFEPPEDEDVAVLKFFKAAAPKNQTMARADVQRLLADEANVVLWNSRPAEALQREQLRFYGKSLPKGLTVPAAAALINSTEAELAARGSPLVEEWEAYQRLIEEFSDRETCEDHGIKKPSLADIRAAVEELRKTGRTTADLSDEPADVAEKMLEMKPDLARP
jgi:hypothetical protein